MKLIANLVFILGLIFAVMAWLPIGMKWLNTLEAQRTVITLNDTYLHTGNHVPVTEFKAGDVIFLHALAKRTKECSLDLNYRILSEDQDGKVTNRTVWFSYPQTRAAIPPGTFSSDVRLELPTWLHPGDYEIDRNVTYLCDWQRIVHQRALPFTIVVIASS